MSFAERLRRKHQGDFLGSLFAGTGAGMATLISSAALHRNSACTLVQTVGTANSRPVALIWAQHHVDPRQTNLRLEFAVCKPGCQIKPRE
jgi:hypothetical protein